MHEVKKDKMQNILLKQITEMILQSVLKISEKLRVFYEF